MRFALGVEYDGSQYSGWQRQSHAASVQQLVEIALGQVANAPVEVFCAGRTDAGVHGTGQVIHFETSSPRPEKAWVLGGNAHLPTDIRIKWAAQVPDTFHARFSATARRYRYLIKNTAVRPAIGCAYFTWVRDVLNAENMHQAAQCLLGELDFKSFQAAECQSKSSFRYMEFIQIYRQHDLVIVDLQANAFLHHMVRNIVGSLLQIGVGRKPVDWMQSVLGAKDRCQAGVTAPANGLYLIDVTYPEQFELPKPALLGPFHL